MKRICVLLISLLLLTSCNRNEPENTPHPHWEPKVSHAVTITLGLLPDRNIFDQKRSIVPLTRYLEQYIDANIRFVILNNYQDLFSSIAHGKIDGAFFDATSYLHASKLVELHPVAFGMHLNNSITSRYLIVGRRDSALPSSPLNWTGVSVASSDPQSAASLMFHNWYLKQFSAKTAFPFNETSTGSHDGSMYALISDTSDVAIVPEPIYKKYADTNPRVMNSFTVLAETPELPTLAIGLVTFVPSTIREQFSSALLNLHMTRYQKEVLNPLQLKQFVRADQKILQEAGRYFLEKAP